MKAQVRHDPERGAGHAIIDLKGFAGQDVDVLFSLRRASDGRYLGSGGWLEAEQRLTPDMVQRQGGDVRLLVGPAVVDMLDMLDVFAITAYPAEGEGRRFGLEIGDLIYSDLAGGQGVAQAASAPLSMSPMPEMRFDLAPEAHAAPEPAPPPAQEPPPEPEPPLPELKDPVEHKSKAPLILLLLVLACIAGGIYWWKTAQSSQNAPPAVNATVPASAPESPSPAPPPPTASAPPAPASQAAPEASPSKETPPLQRARELLRAGASPEEAMTLAMELTKDMQIPEGADGAFLLLEDAAQKGKPEAMLALARFYDPADTAPKGSILPDPEQARNWYNRAKEQGQNAADDKLNALRAWAESEKDTNPQAKSLLDNWK